MFIYPLTLISLPNHLHLTGKVIRVEFEFSQLRQRRHRPSFGKKKKKKLTLSI